MGGDSETIPATVPKAAKQAGEAHMRWHWVEPSVWTDRMLAALENGVKGGKKNAFFVKQGLFSFQTASILARQPAQR